MFHIVRNKEAWLSDHMQITNEEAHWNVPFCRAAQDWEVEVVVTFYASMRLNVMLGWGDGPYLVDPIKGEAL